MSSHQVSSTTPYHDMRYTAHEEYPDTHVPQPKGTPMNTQTLAIIAIIEATVALLLVVLGYRR